MQQLSLAVQDFKELRTRGAVYVDKTQLIHQLLISGKAYFLSRPRRFGKSLLLSTIKAVYTEPDLFEGLQIKQLFGSAWPAPRPVIHLSLAGLGVQFPDIRDGFAFRIEQCAKEFDNIKLGDLPPGLKLEQLIRQVAAQSSDGKVVLLIDEYESPVTDVLSEPTRADLAKEGLKGLFGPLKDLDAYLGLIFVTGVSKFSKTSLFSALNHLVDISASPDFATICGYTHEELVHYFGEHLQSLALKQQKSLTEQLCELQGWYDGYSWNGLDFVYAPHSVNSALWHKQIENYWFQSGTPTFLIKLLQERWEYSLSDREVSSAIFEELDHTNINPLSLLFQAGYLTIKESLGPRTWRIGFPNKEVRISLLTHLSAAFANSEPAEVSTLAAKVANTLVAEDFAGFFALLESHFSSIPYHLYKDSRERIFHATLYTLLAAAFSEVGAEVSSSRGRAHVVLKIDDQAFVLECKVASSAAAAISQIEHQGYLAPLQAKYSRIFGLGLAFDSKRGSREWEVKRFF